MVDVRGDVLRPPHGTTPAAVKSNKNQDPGFPAKSNNNAGISTDPALLSMLK